MKSISHISDPGQPPPAEADAPLIIDDPWDRIDDDKLRKVREWAAKTGKTGGLSMATRVGPVEPVPIDFPTIPANPFIVGQPGRPMDFSETPVSEADRAELADWFSRFQTPPPEEI